MQGEDHPGFILVFQSKFVSALKFSGGLASSGAIPEFSGPLNCIQCMDSGMNLELLSELHEGRMIIRAIKRRRKRKCLTKILDKWGVTSALLFIILVLIFTIE
jgi:hypothetical protein